MKVRISGYRFPVLLVAVILAGCSTSTGIESGEVVELADDHPAVAVLAAGPTFDEFLEFATEQNRQFVCAASGAADGGPVKWEVCLVLGDGVLGVVPFDVPSGLTGVVEGADLDGAVSFPLDGGAIGIPGVDSGVTLTLTLDGEIVGSVEGP